ncbi:MAG: hypothetical protein AseanaTS_16110 [Candidatus Pelagadaptatus aseana]|uniref:zinc ribbon-containing protein n=1 Tax=Candidatus Pelagadaptatus aseana TaxID=3120508 RepID=UPI0039B26317
MVQRQRADQDGQAAEVSVKDRLLEINRPAQRITIDSPDEGSSADPVDVSPLEDSVALGAGTSNKPQGDQGFWHELLSELMYLEATSAYWALQAANPADIDYQKLQRSLQSSQVIAAGETASNEHLTCLQCFHHYFAQGTVELAPCQCGCQYFSVGQRH